VTNMRQMFDVRVLPSRLLLTRRHVVVARPFASRSALTPPNHPSFTVL